MSLRTIDDLVDTILMDEGGIADVGDGQGITRYGQTSAWLADNGFTAPDTADEAAANYRAWMRRTGLWEVASVNVLVGYVAADFAIHSGLGPGIRALQRSVGVTADGSIGPVTIGALKAASPRAVAAGILAERLVYLGALLASVEVDRRDWAQGWLGRVARQVRFVGAD
jgi:lysozyme family protein